MEINLSPSRDFARQGSLWGLRLPDSWPPQNALLPAFLNSPPLLPTVPPPLYPIPMSPRPRPNPGAPRRVSKTERWLNLLAFLLDRRYPVPREQILTQVEDYRSEWVGGDAKAKESVRRKFERDKSELRDLGIVIEPGPQRVTAGHAAVAVDAYQLRARDLYLPYLELTTDPSVRQSAAPPYALPSVALKPDEFAVLRRAAERVLALGDTPLGASAQSALRKLSFDLPGVASAADEIGLSQPVHPGFEKVFAVLREGVETRTPVTCRYYAIGRDKEEERIIEPYGLMLAWGHWYCIARAPERQAIRVFRLDRMRTAALAPGDPARFTVPAGFSIEDYLDRAPWELSEAPAVTTRVRIGFPHSRWVVAEDLGRVIDPVDAEGGALFEFDVRAPDAFIRWLLPFGPQAEILDPADLASRLAAERERLRAVYR